MKPVKTYLTIILAGLTMIAANAAPASAGWGDRGMYFPGGHMMGGGYMGWTMILFWGLLLIALIMLIRWIAKLPQDRSSSSRSDKTALDILQECLASGEIDIEEYKKKKTCCKAVFKA